MSCYSIFAQSNKFGWMRSENCSEMMSPFGIGCQEFKVDVCSTSKQIMYMYVINNSHCT